MSFSMLRRKQEYDHVTGDLKAKVCVGLSLEGCRRGIPQKEAEDERRNFLEGKEPFRGKKSIESLGALGSHSGL